MDQTTVHNENNNVIELVAGIPGIELCQNGGRDTLQHLLGENAEQLPADVQRFVYWTVLVVTLRDEVLFEFRQELQVQEVIGRQRLLTYYGLHGLHVLSNGVASVLQTFYFWYLQYLKQI